MQSMATYFSFTADFDLVDCLQSGEINLIVLCCLHRVLILLGPPLVSYTIKFLKSLGEGLHLNVQLFKTKQNTTFLKSGHYFLI